MPSLIVRAAPNSIRLQAYIPRWGFNSLLNRSRLTYPFAPATYSTMTENTPTAEYRQLGKSGLRVSVPILGAMSIGDPRWMDWVIGEEEVGSFVLSFVISSF